ncbi:MAG: family 20 glycosylhydrolase, partial [Candidatus Glassbacteria bacterium]|nr:family 20 glycosylhydrolase [Candidatus Glassbacteria bacterium]
ATESSGPADYGVLPRPAELTPGQGSFPLAEGVSLVLCRGTGPEDLFACSQFNAWAAELGFAQLPVSRRPGPEQPAGGAVLVGPALPGSSVALALEELGLAPGGIEIPAEGYVLAVGPRTVVAAGDDAAGRFYALMTLAQLLRQDSGGAHVPAVVVRDRPRLGLRGVSDDISRGQVSTLEDLKSLVLTLARYKMNVYMPYLEDMFTFTSHPESGKGRGALTAAEVAELADFAGQCHVRVIPIFQTLGHYENLLLKDGYRQLAEFPGAACLSPAVEETYSFLQQVLSEIVPAFRDEFFNIACDESWDVGRGKSRDLVRKLGIAGVHAGHYRRVHRMVTGLGRRVMIYGDIILNNPAILEDLPGDMVVVDWHYNAARQYPSVARFRQAGLDVVVSPGVSNWNRFYPDYRTALTNIENLTREGCDQGALGAVVSSWCDNGGANLRQLNVWGYAFAACCAWNPGDIDREALERDFWRGFLAVDDPAPWLEVNRLLGSLGRGSTIYDWWRHPLLGPSSSGGTGKNLDSGSRGAALKNEMARLQELINRLGPPVRANRWFVDLAAFTASVGDCLAGKYLWQDEYRRAAAGPLSASTAGSLAAGADSLRSCFAAVRGDFARLWKRHNRPEGLEHNLALFDRQLAQWEIIAGALREGRLPPEPTIDRYWIAAPGSAGSKKLKRVRTSYFRGRVGPQAPGPHRVLLQVMGTGHAEVFLNGEPAGETIGRRTLSLIVESSRARVLDLTGRWLPGGNDLAVRVTNYEGRVPAANIYCEAYGPGGQVRQITSGPGWRGLEARSEPAGWSLPSFDDSGWGRCTGYDIGLPVSAPLLAQGINSRIER